ncbi:hypothetical protein JY651_19550 [Pyxidicoccus parkwayensis]|uniref:Glycerophosphoryl diester phosphodiesterase membrane domain-containing protein n=2 Tax=Pyxidicoccus parkwayensis TaxID=2813578 RepID=A0ABX7PCG9_9BACT|nr:hypothetical protein JY651_19550 [Pyxidicoccus parkwaysis]
MIDRAATFWRAHLKPLFLLSFGFSLVNYIAMKATILAGRQLSPMLYASDMQAQAQRDPTGMLGQTGVSMGLWMVLFGVIFFIYWMATLATSRYVVSAQLGEPVSPADSLRRAFSRAGPLTGAYVCSIAWAMLIAVLLLGPGVILGGIAAVVAGMGSNTLALVLAVIAVPLAVLGLIAAMLWYFLRFLLLPPVMAMEDLGAWDSFKRSGELLSGRIGPGFLDRVVVRAMILYTVMSLILISVQLVSSIPSWLVMAPYGSPFDAGTMARTPQYLLVPAELVQVVAQSCFTPIYYVFCSLFYLDMRVRREALDLERRMDAPSTTTLAV